MSSLGFEAPLDLKPRTRYRWSVTVWGDQGDWAAASSWFETAKEGEPWQGKWIAADFADKEAQPLLTKDFTLGAEPVSARLYACGLGIYEAESQRPEGRGRVPAARLPLLRLCPGVPDLRRDLPAP